MTINSEDKEINDLIDSCVDFEDNDKLLKLYYDNSDNLKLKLNIENKLIKINEKLVKKRVGKYARIIKDRSSFDEFDMLAEGEMGLLTAIRKFDLSKDSRLSTYATWWIDQRISRAIIDQSSEVRIPVHYQEKINKMNKLKSKNLSYARISEELEIPLAEVEKMEKIYYEFSNVISYDGYQKNETDSLDNFINQDSALNVCQYGNTEKYINDKINHDEIHYLMHDTLRPKEIEILSVRYGLIDGEEHTLEQIGKAYGVTRERIRQIQVKAERKLKEKIINLRGF